MRLIEFKCKRYNLNKCNTQCKIDCKSILLCPNLESNQKLSPLQGDALAVELLGLLIQVSCANKKYACYTYAKFCLFVMHIFLLCSV